MSLPSTLNTERFAIERQRCHIFNTVAELLLLLLLLLLLYPQHAPLQHVTLHAIVILHY